MIKLEKLDKNIINKHLEWCNEVVKSKLDKRIKDKSTNFQNLLKKCSEEFKTLVIGENLKSIIEELEKLYSKCSYNDKEEIKKIFNYEYFASNKNKKISWNRHIFLSSLNISVCPYCDRQYITNYSENKSTADADHFYSQSNYPYLALNIYNLIPSCQICNRNFKGSKDISEGIYPYTEEFGKDAIFIINDEAKLLLENNDDISIELKVVGNSEKIKKNIEIFKLNEVYKKAHNKYIKNMLDTLLIYPEEYVDEIGDLFQEKDKEEIVLEIKDLLKKPYLFRVENNEPLAKLTKDILINYKIIKEDE